MGQHFNVLSDRIIRVVIYARYSCSNQTEQSIEGQLADCERFAERCGFQIVGTYIDRALTATTDRRPQFQQMIKDSEKGMFDVIVVWKLDRFARNRYDSAVYKQRLKNNGVRVMSAMENIDDSPEGVLMESVLEGFAEYFSRDLSQKVQRGMRETAAKHKVTGIVPYGYKKSPEGTYVPDEQTAPVVKKIFELYAGGILNKDIVEWLNTHGYRTSNGNLFQNQYLRKILSRRRYTGSYTYGNMELHDENQRIIDDDLFLRVQKQLKVKQKHGGGRLEHEPYLLTSKLRCGYCKNTICGESGHNHQGKVYQYYTCTTNKKNSKGEKCLKKNEKKNSIEDATVNFILNNFFNEEIIDLITAAISTAAHDENNSSDLISIRSQIENTEKKINNIMSAIEAGIFTSSTQQRLKELERVRDKLQCELAVAQTKQNNFNAAAFTSFMKNISSRDFKTFHQRQQLISLTLHSEYLWNDKVLYILYFTPADMDEDIDIDEYIQAVEKGSECTPNGVP